MHAIRRLLVANRSEIAIRVFRSAHELGIRTVGIYTHEDRYALHRFKADEAYPIGRPGEPIRSYLDVEAILTLARRERIDAIHPGYGFLSENASFARACGEAGIVFVGPRPETLAQLGDKTAARRIAVRAGVPVLAGSEHAIADAQEGRGVAEKLTFPVIVKAAHGGGGRGMRVVRTAAKFTSAFEEARRESLTAFGSAEVFVEKLVERARHIEVQVLGDKHGNRVHLFERDCSVQRRHQKVVEIAPAPRLDAEVRAALCDAALAIAREVDYENAGTFEFLVDSSTGDFYFIEVNPRIQVEHTVTEQVTGVDLVKSQILLAEGRRLDDPDIALPSQDAVGTHGYALQCRVTTEDPENDFMPDYGRIAHYRSASGMGIRLDAGTAFSGAVVFPYYDSLLVKVTAWARRFEDATRRMERCLQEFRVRGVKTNIPFLIKLVMHPTFVGGGCTTRFIDETPELFQFPTRRDRATKLLTYLAEAIVNGNPLVKDQPKATRRAPAPVPTASSATTPFQGVPPAAGVARSERSEGRGGSADDTPFQSVPPAISGGMRPKLQEMGAEKFSQWILKQRPLLFTDTTFRDAHQSLLATRVRTYDLLRIAESCAQLAPQLFSIEMWGGATFDVSLRFLKECPWQRLVELRERVPNILFQMLLRASNAVGYTNYPDNVVKAFVNEAADAGIDVFRVFDALNWLPNLRVAMNAVLRTGAVCEAALCYTGDIQNPNRTKYDLKYYVKLAKELEKRGAHILAIKDMAGLCKPYAAELLVKTLKQEVGIPIHFHTHDTGGIQAASIVKAADVGLDIADGACAAMSGRTSQPNLNTVVEAVRFTPRASDLSGAHLDAISEYWRAVREFYTPFESPVLAAGADLYQHEMPGGQYSNLFQQARALGLAERWPEVCRRYADANGLLGDLVKVTPTSKAVGDLALFMVAGDLSGDDILNGERELAFPQSVVDLVSGRMGQTAGGFPKRIRERILRGEKPLRGRPGASLPPADFAQAEQKLRALVDRKPSRRDVLSYLLYPNVYPEFAAHQNRYSDTSVLPTPVFLYGMEPGEEIAVDIEPGKTLILKFLAVGDAHADGRRTVFYELNGQPRDVTVRDRSIDSGDEERKQADPADRLQVAAPLSGLVASVAVGPGERVAKGQKLITLEAMKMESTLYAEQDGKVAEVLVERGTHVEPGDLVVRLEGE